MPRSIASWWFTHWKYLTIPKELLREVWRVLAPSGRMMAIIPNRRGVWTRTDTTPFGHGRPYSRSQITHSAAANLVHADGLGRSAVHAADRRRMDLALGDGVGADERCGVFAVCRRAHRGGVKTGLSRHSGAPRADPADSSDAAGVRANADPAGRHVCDRVERFRAKWLPVRVKKTR